MLGPDRAVILQQFSLKMSPVWILHTILCTGHCFGLFSPALDAAELTLKVGYSYRSSVLGQWRQ